MPKPVQVTVIPARAAVMPYLVATRPGGWKNVESADTALKTMQFGREGFHDTYLNHAVKLSTVNINNASTMDLAIRLINSPSLQARAGNENKEYLEKLPEVDELHSAGLELIRQRIGVDLVVLANAEHRIIDAHIPLSPPDEPKLFPDKHYSKERSEHVDALIAESSTRPCIDLHSFLSPLRL
ncbi:hypothetical protein PG989_015494 [Apiospora arundinis]